MKIYIENYKSIVEKQYIEANGLSIISGTNSSGKSSFMQPLLIIKQTIENNTDGKSLIINGENVNLTEHNQLLPLGTKYKSFSITIEEELGKTPECATSTFKYTKKTGFTCIRSTQRINGKSVTLKPDMTAIAIKRQTNKINANHELPKNILKILMDDKELTPFISQHESSLSINFKFTENSSQFLDGGFYNPSKKITDFCRNMIHIPGIRSNPEREYKIESYTNVFQGQFDKYTASIIWEWTKNNDEKLKELIKAMSYLGIASNISAKKLNEAFVNVNISRFQKSKDDDIVNLSDVGFGVSQLLPILVSLIISTEKNSIYIEQPELHLHPKAQLKLAKIVCDYSVKNKNIIIETHSAIFIKGIQTEVAKREKLKNLVSINWFKQERNGHSKIESIILDANGAYGDLPADFDTTELDADNKYIKAVENNLFN